MKASSKMKQQRSVFLLLVLGSAFLLPSAGGCSKKVEQSEEVRNCDIPALFAGNCAGSGCHASEDPQADLDLVSPGVERRLFHIEATDACGKQKLVDPGNPARSLLYQKVVESDPPCGEKMPPRRKLSDSAIACLRNYIERAGIDADGTQCETCGGILCVDFKRDPKHCGGCDAACSEGQVCGGGECLNPCTDGQTLCGASCVTLADDDDHCGRCGHRCGPGSRCADGACICDLNASGANGQGGSGAEDPDEVPSFAEDILPIFENSCSGSDCHTGGDRVAPLDLDPSDAYAHLVDVTAEDCGSARLVVPNSPDSSYLVDKLMGGSLCEGSQMPLSNDPLPNAAIGTIVNWICAGAPDN